MVQLGAVTSMFSGNMVTHAAAKNHWQQQLDMCQHALPHTHFDEKVDREHQPQEL
jgi:hypothetical protein